MPATATPERGPDGKFVKSDAAPADESNEQQQAPVKETEKPVKMTEDQNESASIFAADFVTGNKPERKKVEAKAKPVEVKKDEEKPAPAVKKPDAKPAAMTAESIAKAVSEGVATAMKPTAKEEKKADDKPVDPDAGLPDEEKRKLTVLRYLERLQPDKYKGVADKYKSNVKKLSDYAAKWEKDNPGQTFDDEAEEHTEFFEKNKLFQPWDDEDYTDAKAEMIAEKKIAEATAESNKKLSALERHNKVLESRPIVRNKQTVAARTYWKQIGGDFDELVQENGYTDPKKEKELQEKNPDLYNATVGAAIRLDALVEQTYLLKNNLVEFSKSPPPESLKFTDEKAYNLALDTFNKHQYLKNFAISKEQKLLARPLENQVNEAGQQFKPAIEYFSLPKQERDRFWTFDENDLADLLAKDESRKMKAYIAGEEEKFNRWAKSKGLALKESVLEQKADEQDAKPADEQIAEKVAGLQEEAEEEKAPSSSASPKSATILDEGKAGQKSGLETWGARIFG